MKMSKRILSAVLTLLLLLSMVVLPKTAHAAEEQTGSEPAAKTEVISSSTEAAGDDWSWTGDDDKIATLPYGEITADEIYVAAVATNYWTNNTYTDTATPVTVTFAEGEGLVTIALRLRKEDVIWQGAECVYAEITPTDAASAITEDTAVSGTFQMHYAPWGSVCEVPFSVLIKAPETDEEPAAKTEVISDSTEAAGDDWNWTGDDDKIATLPYGEITADEIYVAAVATNYWTNNTYTDTATPTQVTFTEGEGLVTIALRLRKEDVIWQGAECVYAEITPTDAASAITEDTAVSGTFQMHYAPWGSACEVPFSVLIKAPEADEEPAAKTEVISDSTEAAGDDWNWTGDGDKIAALPYGEITVNEIYVAAVATNYWTNNTYTDTATPTQVTFTEGEGLVTIALRLRKEDVIWQGAECVYAEITPTEAAAAITEDTAVSGTFQMHYAPWGSACEVPFEILLKPETNTDEPDTPGGEEGGNESGTVTKTEVISSSTQAAGDDWNWTGDGDKIASLPYGEIKVTQTYVAAVATNYWTNNTYTTTATPTTVTFTEGEGLVTIALRLRKEDVIWYGAECVYAEITPTAAAEAITEPVKVSGTFQMHYAPWGRACEVPFEILLKPDDGDNRQIVPLKDMSNQAGEAVNAMIAGKEDIPYIHEVISADSIYRGLFLRTAMLNYLPCSTDGLKCPTVLGYKAEDLKIKVTHNANLAAFSAEIGRYDGDAWGDCFYIYVTPTAEAKNVEPGTYVGGVIYFEENGHKTRQIPFRFFFDEAGYVPQPEQYVVLSQMPDQVYNALTTVRLGGTMTPVHATLQYGESYRGMIMREAMVLYTACDQELTWCNMLDDYGLEHLKIDVQTNADLVTFRTELAQHDGAAWGNCYYLYAQLTEAARDVEPGTAITGQIYFEGNGHKTRPVPFVFSIGEENTLLTAPYDYPWSADMELITVGDLPDQINEYIVATRNGTRLEPVTMVVQPAFKYAGIVMTETLIPFVLCEVDGIYCPESLNFGVENLVATFTENGDMVEEIRFEVADYSGWGVSCIYMFVRFNEKAQQAERGTLIDGTLSFQKDGHKTQDIQLKMYLFENPNRDQEESGTRVVEDVEEEPTAPTPEKEPTPVQQEDNSSLVLILVLAAAALLLIWILLILLLLLKKKKNAETSAQ